MDKDKVNRWLISMYHNLGAVIERQGRPAEAEAAYTQALAASEKLLGKDHPESEATLAALSGVLWAQHKVDEARGIDLRRLAIQTRVLDDAIRRQPDNSNLYRDRAYLLCRAGRFKDAIADFNKAIELDPDDHWKYYMAAPVYLYAGDVEGYRRACRELVRRFADSDAPEIGERVAKASLLEPDPDGDLELFAKLIERAAAQGKSNPYLDWFKTSLGLAEYRRGHYDRAIEAVNGLPEDGRMPWVYGRGLAGLVLAMAQARAGHGDDARRTLAEVEARVDAAGETPGACDLGAQFSNWCIYQVVLSQARSVAGKPPRQAPP